MGWISLKDRLIILPKEITKDQEDHIIPISDQLYGMLAALPRGIRYDMPVFTHDGKPVKDFRAALQTACKKADIPYGRKPRHFVFHDLRATFVTDMRKAGVADSVSKEITGHSRNGVHDRYGRVDLKDKREAIWKLAEYRKSVYQNVYQVASNLEWF